MNYPAAAQDAELLEKLQAVLDSRRPNNLPEQLVEDVQPVPRLWLASAEFSAFEPRNGKMQRYIQHRAALSFNYLDQYVSGQKNADILLRQEQQTLRIKRKPASIFEYEYEDFEVLDYQCHPAIKAPVAV